MALEPKAFAVLQLLVERAPHVVDKTEIFAVVWKDTAVTDNALTRIVTQLRRALSDDAKDAALHRDGGAAGVSAAAGGAACRERGDARGGACRTRGAAGGGDALQNRCAARPLLPRHPQHRDARGRSPSRSLRPLSPSLPWPAAGVWLARPGRAAAPVGSLGDLDLAIAASLTPQQLTVATGFDGYVAFSPDGATIAYSSDRSGALEIYVEGLAEGSTATSLTHGAGQSIQPAWSPDGRLIAYARDGWQRHLDRAVARGRGAQDRGGRRASVVVARRHAHRLSIAAARRSQPWRIVRRGLDHLDRRRDGRTPPRALTARGRPLGSHGMPQWLPGTGRVLFAVVAPAGVFDGRNLWTVAPDTGDLRPLSTSMRLSSEFVASPDGRGVLFAARDTNALWWLPISGGGLRPGEPRPTALPATGPLLASLAMSADGRRIAWTAGASSSGIWSAGCGRGDGRDGPDTARAGRRGRLARGKSRHRAGWPDCLRRQPRQRRQQDLPRRARDAARISSRPTPAITSAHSG